jgi:hypothetical protein
MRDQPGSGVSDDVGEESASEWTVSGGGMAVLKAVGRWHGRRTANERSRSVGCIRRRLPTLLDRMLDTSTGGTARHAHSHESEAGDGDRTA